MHQIVARQVEAVPQAFQPPLCRLNLSQIVPLQLFDNDRLPGNTLLALPHMALGLSEQMQLRGLVHAILLDLDDAPLKAPRLTAARQAALSAGDTRGPTKR